MQETVEFDADSEFNSQSGVHTRTYHQHVVILGIVSVMMCDQVGDCQSLALVHVIGLGASVCTQQRSSAIPDSAITMIFSIALVAIVAIACITISCMALAHLTKDSPPKAATIETVNCLWIKWNPAWNNKWVKFDSAGNAVIVQADGEFVHYTNATTGWVEFNATGCVQGEFYTPEEFDQYNMERWGMTTAQWQEQQSRGADEAAKSRTHSEEYVKPESAQDASNATA